MVASISVLLKLQIEFHAPIDAYLSNEASGCNLKKPTSIFDIIHSLWSSFEALFPIAARVAQHPLLIQLVSISSPSVVLKRHHLALMRGL